MSIFLKRRKAVWNQAAKDNKFDGLLVSGVTDVSYLTGFTGDDSMLLISDRGGSAALLTDGRFDEQAAGECPGIDIVLREGAMSKSIADQIKTRGISQLGVQAEFLNVGMQEAIVKACSKSLKLCTLSSLTERSRSVKDDDEIRMIRKAIRVAESAFKELIGKGAGHFIGKTERQLAGELEYLMRLGGADSASFPTIMCGGENGSRCHHLPSSRKIRKDEAVLIDWGARVGGYCSDLTRVVFTGKIPSALKDIYPVVAEANRVGIEAVKPRRSGKTVDKAARDVIAAAGFGKQFVHSLGHGLGMDVHESPALSSTSKTSLRPGMVVTVEPGIYIPGVGGIRIEDDVLVTSDGVQRLTTISRSLRQLVLS